MSPEGYMAASAIVVAAISAIGSYRATVANQPKMSAEAKAADATGETSISADARAWADKFEGQADKAIARADAAEQKANAADERANAAQERAEAADERADAAEIRLLAIERRMDRLQRAVVDYVGSMQRTIVELGGHPVPPPDELIPPLTRPEPPAPR